MLEAADGAISHIAVRRARHHLAPRFDAFRSVHAVAIREVDNFLFQDPRSSRSGEVPRL